MTSTPKLYKIVSTAEWNQAKESADKLFIGTPLDLKDKFFHLSTPEQVPGTLGLFYKNAGANGALTLIEIDRKAYEEYLKADGNGELKWEHPPVEGDTRLFPHGYSETRHGGIPAIVDGVLILKAEPIEEDASNPGVYKTFLTEQASTLLTPEQYTAATSFTTFYKICTTAEWLSAQSSPEKLFLGTALDLRDKFMHMSTDVQVPQTLARFYKNAGNVDGGVMLIEIDRKGIEEYLKSNDGYLKWEHPRGVGDTRLFPHGYSKTNGAIPAFVDGVVVKKAEVIQEDEENPGVYKTWIQQ